MAPISPDSKPSSKSTRSKSRSRRRAKAAAPETAPDAPAAVEDEAEISYTIDELTAATGTPSRTIRFYQSSGVLPKPTKRGRIAYYGQLHIERLELIGKMQDRGLRMRAIKDLVEQVDRGELELGEWLGLEQQLTSAWSDDLPKVFTRAELDERLGSRRPGYIAELARGGLLEIQSEDAYFVHSPGLLQIASRLDDAGIGVEVAIGASEILQKHLAKAARELTGLFADQIGGTLPGPGADSNGDNSFRELRSISLDSVRLIFAREMEQRLRKIVETGAASRLDKKSKRQQRVKKRKL